MVNFKIPNLTFCILSTLKNSGFQAYIVGGAVRDMLQKKPVYDWDFTTNAVPQQILNLFRESFYDNKFGTVMVAGKHLAMQFKLPDSELNQSLFDITTFRTEFGYTDKRRPDAINWGKSVEEDLGRRDFTINAIALKPPEKEELTRIRKLIMNKSLIEVKFEIVDPFAGRVDLAAKTIRTVGDPNVRFNEDALRMMRAVRIGSQLGFAIEKETLNAIRSNGALIKHVSWERIGDELMKIISSNYPADGILLLRAAGILDYILPELINTRDIPQAGHHIYDVQMHSIESLRHCPSTDPIVRFATLLHDVGKAKAFRKIKGKITFYNHEMIGAEMAYQIAERLRFSKKDKDKLQKLVRWHMFSYDTQMTDAAIRRIIKRVGKENINDMMLLRVGDRKGGGSKATSWRLRELQERIGEQLYEPMTVSDLKVDGYDVMKELGMKPGPRIGKILNQLFEEVMEDSKKNEREYLLSRIRQLG